MDRKMPGRWPACTCRRSIPKLPNDVEEERRPPRRLHEGPPARFQKRIQQLLNSTVDPAMRGLIVHECPPDGDRLHAGGGRFPGGSVALEPSAWRSRRMGMGSYSRRRASGWPSSWHGCRLGVGCLFIALAFLGCPAPGGAGRGLVAAWLTAAGRGGFAWLWVVQESPADRLSAWRRRAGSLTSVAPRATSRRPATRCVTSPRIWRVTSDDEPGGCTASGHASSGADSLSLRVSRCVLRARAVWLICCCGGPSRLRSARRWSRPRSSIARPDHEPDARLILPPCGWRCFITQAVAVGGASIPDLLARAAANSAADRLAGGRALAAGPAHRHLPAEILTAAPLSSACSFSGPGSKGFGMGAWRLVAWPVSCFG